MDAGIMAWTDAGIMALINIQTTMEASSALAMIVTAAIPAPVLSRAHTCKVAPGMATACLILVGMHVQIRIGAPTSWILCVMCVAMLAMWPLIATCLQLHILHREVQAEQIEQGEEQTGTRLGRTLARGAREPL